MGHLGPPRFPVVSRQDFDEDQSDAAYSDSFQNDYGSRSSGSSSPRDKKERSVQL